MTITLYRHLNEDGEYEPDNLDELESIGKICPHYGVIQL